jgi:hypothetical protein
MMINQVKNSVSAGLNHSGEAFSDYAGVLGYTVFPVYQVFVLADFRLLQSALITD